MTDETGQIEERIKKLRALLSREIEENNRQARLHDFATNALFYASMLFGALAVGAGLVKSISIPTELISLFAALGTGFTFSSREAKFRAKADWFYSVRDTASQLALRLDHEMPIPITRENVAAISSEWRQRREELGNRMLAINSSSEAPHRDPTIRKS
jgi:hypothetical protein